MDITCSEITAFLARHVGPQLLARTVGVDPGAVERWAHGTTQPSSDEEHWLRIALDAWSEAAQIEAPETVRAWWIGMKEALDDLSPAEAIAAGRGRDVLAVARAYVQRG